MASGASPTLVGGFVLGALALAVAGVFAFSGLDLAANEVSYVAYFESAVTGLDVGAPIRFQGVRVGRVSNVYAVYDDHSKNLVIPVTLTIEPGAVRVGGGTGDREAAAATIQLMIERGLKAELSMDSFVTGKLFVALNYFPDEEPRYVNEDLVELPEMPTTESNIDKLMKSIAELPIEDLVDGANDTLTALHAVVSDPRIGEILGKLDAGLDQVGPLADAARETLDDVRGLVARVETRVDPAGDELHELVVALREGVASVSGSVELVVAEAQAALRPLDRMLEENRELPYRVQTLLGELTSATRAVRNLVDYLDRHPEALLRGKR